MACILKCGLLGKMLVLGYFIIGLVSGFVVLRKES